jgi:hypothetical protein
MERVKLKVDATQKGPQRGSVRASNASRRIGAGATIKPKPKKVVSAEFEEQRGKGRPKGSTNKVTQLMKDAAIIAAQQLGENLRGRGGLEGFFRRMGRREPVAFLGFLGKLIPLQVQHGGGLEPQEHVHQHYHTIGDIRAALKQRGLNVDEIYEKPMKVIEHRKDELKVPPREMSSVQKAMIGRG